MQCMSALNNTTYKAALYTFDTGLNTLQSLTTPTAAGTSLNNIQLFTVDHQNCVVSRSCTSHRLRHGYRGRAHEHQRHHAYPRPRQQYGRRYPAGGGLPRHRRRRRQDHLERSACNPSATLRRSAPTIAASSHSTRRYARPSRTAASASRSSTRSICNSPTDQLVHYGHISAVTRTTTLSSSTGTIAQNLQSCASPGLVRRRSNRRRHLGSADESVHQGRVKHRQPHAVRKTPWPKWKSHREKDTAIVAPPLSRTERAPRRSSSRWLPRHFSPLSPRSSRRFSFSLRNQLLELVVRASAPPNSDRPGAVSEQTAPRPHFTRPSATRSSSFSTAVV